jgi:choline dehydrogenase-like flavoprotein
MHDDRRVIVVGSGPAGAIAAMSLADAGIQVTLLEAGPERFARGLTARLAGLTVARLHRDLALRSEGVVATGDPRAVLYEDLAPGGLTNHWSCAVPRFSREDFADAQRAGEAHAWPIGYDDLRAWYDRVEPLLHVAGAVGDVPRLPAGKVRHASSLGASWAAVAAEAEREGRNLLPVPYAYGASTTLTLSGTVFNSFVRLLGPARRSGRLAIRCDARVRSLQWSSGTRRVEAVLFRDTATGEDHRLPCRAVVLAAGAINTARILLESTSPDFPAGLGNTHGVLGHYLHDHPLAKIELELASPVAVRPPAYLTRGPLGAAPPLYAAACVQWSSAGIVARSVLEGRPGHRLRTGFNVFGTMAPSEDDFVAIDPSRRNSAGEPALLLHVRHPPESGATLLATRDLLLDLLARTGLKPQVRSWHLEPVGTSVHYAGTCRMHASPRFGMLDRWNRLHEVPNVVVADSAAFTTGPEKNPALTAMALSARAAARLAQDLRDGTIA